jgi:hypothetical protein
LKKTGAYVAITSATQLPSVDMPGDIRRRAVDRAETIDGIAAGKEVGKWVDNLMIVAQGSTLRVQVAFD